MLIKLLAPAKINLTLTVGEKLPNGYHDIDTIMQAVSLCDIITIETTNGMNTIKNIGVSVSGPFAAGVPTDESNICVKAAKLFIDNGINIHIEKNIPHGAGLGGGSSDAAAVIIGLNAMLGKNESPEQMELAACNIGADVPFFIRGGLQRCTGIGMDLSEAVYDYGVTKPRIVIAMGKQSMSTAEAYRILDEKNLHSFDEAITNPEIADIKEMLRDSGAATVSLSGSGAAVFGIFEGKNFKSAQKIKYKMREKGYFCEIVEPFFTGGKVTWAQT
jgi:4-diphosphocytidyl-2-C-methyl-D-erythritol kinase